MRLISGCRRVYGAGPLHLLLLLGCFALTGYVLFELSAAPLLPRILLWFAAAVIGHDLVLFPLYALADRVLTATVRTGRAAPTRSPIPLVNHIRVPVLATGLLFLVFLPGIIEQGVPTYHAATGQTQAPFLGRWLLITACLFAISALVYVLRLATTRYRMRREQRRLDDAAPSPSSQESTEDSAD